MVTTTNQLIRCINYVELLSNVRLYRAIFWEARKGPIKREAGATKVGGRWAAEVGAEVTRAGATGVRSDYSFVDVRLLGKGSGKGYIFSMNIWLNIICRNKTTYIYSKRYKRETLALIRLSVFNPRTALSCNATSRDPAVKPLYIWSTQPGLSLYGASKPSSGRTKPLTVLQTSP